MTLAPSTANWHWKSKNVSPWAKDWLESQLKDNVIFTEGTTSVKIDSLRTFEGDAEISMRKSKLITIYDLRLEYEWSGVASDGTEVKGTVTLPDFSHEVGADGDGHYDFETSLLTNESSPVRELYQTTRQKLRAFLKEKFDPFYEAMLAHGKELKVEGTPAGSGAVTPAAGAAPAQAISAEAAAARLQDQKSKSTPKSVNTSVVKVDATFAASSSDLFELLTDEGKISMWSRAPAKAKPEIGSDYSIFAGNIFGKFLELDKPKKVVQSWQLNSPNWPSGHSATLTTTLDQGSDTTIVTYELAGVPTGQEDEIRGNIQHYYIRGFQNIGLGTIL